MSAKIHSVQASYTDGQTDRIPIANTLCNVVEYTEQWRVTWDEGEHVDPEYSREVKG